MTHPVPLPAKNRRQPSTPATPIDSTTMILAGLQKNSFIDYPGKISCVLFTTGCNFVCPYCHNADLARGEYPQRIESAEVIDFLQSRQTMLEGVAITGGEPTLLPGLIDLCRTIKRLGYPIKLDTNGTRPKIIEQLLDERLVDFVAMDIKAPLSDYGPFSKDPQIQEALTASIALIMERAPDYEFRTTCVHPFAHAAAMEAIARSIQDARCYVLQGYNHRAACLDPDFGQKASPSLSTEEMQALQQIAAPWVARCILRG